MKNPSCLGSPICCLVLSTVALWGHGSALAEDLRLTMEAGTDVPLGLGGGVIAKFGPGLRVGASALWTPSAYVDFADDIAQTVGNYNDLTSGLIRAATTDALALRFKAGLEPLKGRPLYVELNYTLLSLGGAFTNDDLGLASGRRVAPSEVSGWDLSATVHQIGFEVGWRFELEANLSLRAALGGSFTVSADVSADPVNPQNPTLAQGIARSGEVYLASVFTQYVHIPILSVAVGWDLIP